MELNNPFNFHVYYEDDEHMQQAINRSLRERMTPADADIQEAIERSQDDEIIRQAVNRERIDASNSEMKRAIRRSQEEHESERATQLALKLSEHEHAIEEILRRSEREQHKLDEHDKVTEEVKLMSMETYRSEEAWAAAQAAAKEASRRAAEEEQHHFSRIWEEGIPRNSPQLKNPYAETDSIFHTLDEGYISSSSGTGSFSKTRSKTPIACVPTNQASSPAQAMTQVHFPGEIIPAAYHGGSRGSTQRFEGANSNARPYGLPLASNIVSDRLSRNEIGHVPAFSETVDCNRLVPCSQNGVANGRKVVSSPSLLPSKIEHHYHGDVFLKTIHNYGEGAKKHKTTESYQCSDPQHNGARVNGLWQKIEPTHSLRQSVGRPKQGTSLIKTLGKRILSKNEPPVPTPTAYGHRWEEEPSLSDQGQSYHRQNGDAKVGFDTRPHSIHHEVESLSVSPPMAGLWDLTLVADTSATPNHPTARSVYDASNFNKMNHSEYFYSPRSSATECIESFYTTAERSPMSSMSGQHLSATPQPESVQYYGNRDSTSLVERLEHEAARTPAMPGAYPASSIDCASRVSSTEIGTSVYATPYTTPGLPPVPPKVPISSGSTLPNLPELGSTKIPHHRRQRRSDPNISYDSALPLRHPRPQKMSHESLFTQFSTMANSPTPTRLRSEVGQSFAYRAIDTNLPLVPGPDQDVKYLGNHAMRDLDRHGWSANMPRIAPVLPPLPRDNSREERAWRARNEQEEAMRYETLEEKWKRLEKQRMIRLRAAL